MNNRNRHTQYRKSVYRRRRIRLFLILSAVAAVVLLALFLIVGNMLNDSVSKGKGNYEDDWNEETENESTLLPTPEIQAYALPLLEDGSTFGSRLSTIGEDANAVCINLNRADGTLLYKSQIASELPGIDVATDASSLSSYLSSIGDLYTSGVLYVTAFEEENDLLCDVSLSVSGALACEALREGVGDVLMIAPTFDADNVEALCQLADRIHATEAEAIVGLTISEEIYTDENQTSLIDKLSKHFNYLCLNTTENGEVEALEHIESRVSEMQLNIMYYKMRVLMPRAETAEKQAEYTELVRKYNASSWQILP